MSKTIKTMSPNIRAKVEGVSLPRVICRRPRRGDTHPAGSLLVRGILCGVPAGYLVGLRRIELCPRGGAIGDPFGKYSPAEKAIFLYSLPMEWQWPAESHAYLPEFRSFGADVQLGASAASVVVRWHDKKSRWTWFIFCVLGHELGHHYRNQNRFRKRRPSRGHEEVGADFHAIRISEAWNARQLKELTGEVKPFINTVTKQKLKRLIFS